MKRSHTSMSEDAAEGEALAAPRAPSPNKKIATRSNVHRESEGRRMPRRVSGGSKSARASRARLPAVLMGGVLDFMPYNEVRSSLLAGKFVALEAAKHVQTLNITAGGQMNARGRAPLRFPNAENINIVCLVTPTTPSEQYLHTISEDAAKRIPFFLLTFPKLRRVFAGGPSPVGRSRLQHTYSRFFCVTSNHREIFCGLVDSCCGAFKTNSFPDSLETLEGISDCLIGARGACSDREHEDPANPCTRCRAVCHLFPLGDVVHFNRYGHDICLRYTDIFSILRGREGGEKIFKQIHDEKLVEVLGWDSALGYCDIDESTEEGKAFCKKMDDLWVWADTEGEPLTVRYIQDYAHIDEFIKAGFNPRAVPREKVYENLLPPTNPKYDNNRCWHVWPRSNFDELVKRGFDIEADAFILVDERTEPVLREICEVLHREDQGVLQGR